MLRLLLENSEFVYHVAFNDLTDLVQEIQADKPLKTEPTTCDCAVPADLRAWEGQRRAHMVPPADGVYLRERHPHRFPRCGGSHPLHVRTQTDSKSNAASSSQEAAVGRGQISRGRRHPLNGPNAKFKCVQDLARHSKGQAFTAAV